MQPDNLNVFDLDGTLIKVNSFKEVSKKLVITLIKKYKFISLSHLIIWYLIRKLGFVEHLKFKQKVVDIFEGNLTEEEKVNIIQTLLDDNINKKIFEEMLKAENCVISTASPFAFASRMSFKPDTILISSLDSKNNFPDPANFGPGKVENLKFYFQNNNVRVSNFYTDSDDDQDLIDFSVNVFMVKEDSLIKIK